MSRAITPYTEQIAASGASTAHQDPATADAGIGEAGRSIGRSLARMAAQHNAIEDDQGRMWAANATAQNEVEQQKARQDRINALDPSAPDYVEKVNALPQVADDDYQASTQQLIENAPNDTARKYVTMHAASGRVRTLQSAIGTTADLNAGYAVSQVDQSVKSNSDVIAGTPDNDTFNSVNERQRQTIMALTTVGPDVKLKLADSSTHAFSLAQVQASAAINPTAFLQSVNAQGGYTTGTGRVRGAVPGQPGAEPNAMPAQPDMLAFANQQLADGKSQVEAMQALTAKYPDRADKFRFSVPQGGHEFVDLGSATPVSTDPQVQPLTDDAIAVAKPPLAGWSNLSWQEKVAAVRGAESAAGQQLASDRGTLSRELKDANAMALAGQTYPDLGAPRFKTENLVRVFGADEGQRAAQELQYNAQVGQFRALAATMPAAQREATLGALAPPPGEGFADKSESYRMAQQAAASVAAEQQKAPIQSAINAGIAGAKPLDFSQPDTLGTQLRDRTVVAATMARDYGTKAQIFTDPEVDQLANALGNLSGKQRIATLANVRIGLNDPKSFAVAMNQLAPKNPTLAYAANLAAKDGVVYIDGKATQPADTATLIADGDIILNGRSLDKQMAKGDEPSMPGGSKAVDFDDKTFKLFFNDALGGAFRTPDAQRSAATEQETYNAVKAYYAAAAYQQGKPLSAIDQKDVSRAVQAVVGSPWKKNGGVLLAPYGVPVEKFQDEWAPRAKAALKSAGYDDAAANQIFDKAVPINLADGKYGFQQGTRLQTDRYGRPIVVDYSQAYAPPPPVQIVAPAHTMPRQ